MNQQTIKEQINRCFEQITNIMIDFEDWVIYLQDEKQQEQKFNKFNIVWKSNIELLKTYTNNIKQEVKFLAQENGLKIPHFNLNEDNLKGIVAKEWNVTNETKFSEINSTINQLENFIQNCFKQLGSVIKTDYLKLMNYLPKYINLLEQQMLDLKEWIENIKKVNKHNDYLIHY